jgi:hypothetical protein
METDAKKEDEVVDTKKLKDEVTEIGMNGICEYILY